MTRAYFNHLLGICFLLVSLSGRAQTVDQDRGCIGLEAQFSSPNLSSYFWDFKDGANSTLQNPVHQYVTPGVYDVTLQEGQNGPVIGTVRVTIFEKPDVSITATPATGCIPLDVSFAANVTIDNDLVLEDIIWTFGDGSTGQGQTINHVYSQVNTFDIFVKLETALNNCDQTVEFNDQVKTETAESVFTANTNVQCDFPAQIVFSNQSSQLQGTTYEWDFGNGATSADFDPGPITFSDRGKFDVELVVGTAAGCTDTSIVSLIIGEPLIDVDIPDTLCVNEQYTIINNTIAEAFDWRVGSPAIRSFRAEPTIRYNTGGTFDIILRASNGPNCFKDTIIQIFIEEPDVDFTMDPPTFCRDNLPYTFNANNPNHDIYIWNNGTDTLNTDPFFNSPGFEERDSLYINLPDSITGTLTAVSSSGCVNTLTKSFGYELAEAYFIPDTVTGINSLTVTFEDFSTSENNIVRRFWRHGDGTTLDLGPNDTIHTHTYDRCGIFHATLFIEDSEGCVDISKAVEINVFCINLIPVPVIGVGGVNCVDDVLNATFAPEILDFHITSDDHRLDHCWTADSLSYAFDYPGDFPFVAIVEFNGILIDTLLDARVIILGSKAVMSHSVQCSDPFTFNFTSRSFSAETFSWLYEGNEISTSSGFTYTFDRLGEHEVSLITNNSEGCPPDTITETVFVTVPVADFTIPDRMCDNISYNLDATASQDVFASCHKGFLWEFETHRPRETQDTILPHTFEAGRQDVTLIIEDINGCKDTTSRSTTVYGITPLTNLDTVTCLPYPKQFADLSESDTTLVAWDWSFGSQDQNPFYEFDSLDLDPIYGDSIKVTFTVEDALGCMDSITQFIEIVEPNFFITSDPNSRACEGEIVTFTVIDTAGISDSYIFEWQFGDQGVATGDTVQFAFTEEGRIDIEMNYVHRNGNCAGTVSKVLIIAPQPDASFTTDIDSLDIICYPRQIEFTSDPSLAGNGFQFEWDFGDGQGSSIDDPVFGFGRGDHEVKLTVTNALGCADSITTSFTLVGPAADFIADNDVLCIDDELNIQVINLENVTNFTIDLGDGSPLIENQTEVTHTYSVYPTVISLFASSEELGCDVIDTLSIDISGVEAFFEFDCGGSAVNNLSIEASEFIWDFGDGLTSTEFNPEIPFDELSGTATIALTAIDSSGNCTSRFETSATSMPSFEMANLFSPNGDGNNDVFMPVNIQSVRDDVRIVTFKIYNRWGELVYDNESADGWAGNIDGELAPPEVYAYHIVVELPGCGENSQKGNVTLIR